MLGSIPVRYKERFDSQKSWVTAKIEIMHTWNERKSQNIRDLYHDIAKTIIREGRLRESEISCAKSKNRQGKRGNGRCSPNYRSPVALGTVFVDRREPKRSFPSSPRPHENKPPVS